MSYQVIARKWRPQSFQELVGQSHVSQTLLNALRKDRLHHALLFTGTRGTGKTSTARILAKALRCQQAIDFAPCQTCSSCTEITEGRSVDVIEIDGASNNGVDAIRELRETVIFMPSSGRYKIYIIDEVHMLSTSAFNALLKTLEEPPAHVVFIMATTDAHKIPATILSRCQRYDFRRIPTREIVEQLQRICQSENINAEDKALWLLAKNGDGSMRDTLSLLEQAMSFTNGAFSLQEVADLMGLTDRTLLKNILSALLTQNSTLLMDGLKKLYSSGTEPILFFKELIEYIRHTLMTFLTTSTIELSALVEASESELQDFIQLQSLTSETDLHLLFDMALKGSQDMARAQDPRLVLDVLLLRMLSAPRRRQIADLLASALPNTKTLSDTASPASAPPTVEKKKLLADEDLSPIEKWVKFINQVRQQDALFAAKLDNLLFLKEENFCLYFAVPQNLVFLKEQMKDSENRKKLQAYIDSQWGQGYAFEVIAPTVENKGESAQNLMVKKQADDKSKLQEAVENHPLVQKAKSVFNGEIKSIKKLSD